MKQFLFTSLILSCTLVKAIDYNPVTIHDGNNRPFTVTIVQSAEEYKMVQKTVGVDFRAPLTDTAKGRSCLSGLSFDSEFTRSQIYAIKQNDTVIGVATLLIVPAAQLEKLGCIQKENDELVFTSYKNALGLTQPNAFSITPGLFTILPDAYSDGLAALISDTVLVPTIHELIAKAPRDAQLVISSGIFGEAPKELRIEITKAWQSFLFAQGKNRMALIPQIAELITKAETASFESKIGERFKLERLPYYNFTLGSLFVKEIKN